MLDHQIHTPDRRIRVFVSSTLGELAEERRAARAAVTGLRLTPVMFELGARPHPPRELYRAYLAQSEIFVGIYWQRYGWVAPGEDVSGLEDEYLLSGDRPKLIYVKTPAPDREDRLHDLLKRIQSDDRVSYKPFADPAELSELLADDLAVLLTERFTARGMNPPDLQASRLPVPPTALVGRSDDERALAALVVRPDVRLVTLVGPGGIGKTRLGLQVAARLTDRHFDGVWFVDLAAITDPDLVPVTVAATLGVRAEGTRPVLDVLADRLRGRHVLLVLDNFEHVRAATADVARLLSLCPGVTLLVTSRTLLSLRGEHAFPLGPLAVPPAGTTGAEDIARSPAVQLFVARAEEVRPGFTLHEGNAAAVAEICRRLDGIPLALELAAARVRLLPPRALLERLGDRLDLHAAQVDLPERQRTLRATIDWSHSLLGGSERALLARLSVFAGGWTLEAAEAVGGQDLDVLETLSSLVAQSLVATDERSEGEPRFRMLDTVRQYARERLEQRGETAMRMARLADYFRSYTAGAGARLNGPENRYWTGRIDAELDNLRAVLSWTNAADRAESAIRIAAPLWPYWWSRGLLAQMLDFAEETAALPSAADLPEDARLLLLWCRGTIRTALGRAGEAVPFLRELVTHARGLGDEPLLAHGLTSLALSLPYEEHAEEMRAMLEGSAALFRRLDDPLGLAYALTPLGEILLRNGDVPAATELHRESLASAERIDNDHLRGLALNQLGLDALLAGDVDTARSSLAAAAQVQRRLFDLEGTSYCLNGFAAVAMAQGSPEVAARLLGAAEGTRAIIGVAIWPLLQPLADGLVAGVRAALGEERFDAAFAEGMHLRTGDALAEALEATAVPA